MKNTKQPSPDVGDFFSFDDLPEGWECKKLGEIVSPSKEKIEPTADSTLPYIGLEHIESNTTKIIGQAIASDAKSTKTVFHSGDVLYGKLRPYLNKVAIPDFDGVCSTDILVFNQNPIIDCRYLMRYLTTGDVVEYANRKSKGISLPRVSFESLSEILIPLPPFAEQQRIVARVEALLTQINAARERLHRVPLITKRFRQAVLAAACSGRLTEGWRENKLALSNIRNEQKIKSQTLGATDPYCLNFKYRNQNELPSEWQYAALKDLGKWYSGGTPSKSHDEYWSGGTIPWISPKDMKKEVLNDSQDHITKPGLDSGRLHLLPKGTILFVVRGLILARDFPIALTECESTINQDMKAIVPNTFVDKRYLLHVLQNEKYKILFATKESTHGTKRLESESLLYWPIPLPSLAEQHEIVRCVGLLFECADAFDQEVAAAGRRCERLTRAVLGKAFSGKL